MKRFKPIRLSDLAKVDLQSIAEYTQKQWGLKQKKQYLDMIKKSLRILSYSISDTLTSGNHPIMGKERPEISNGLHSYSIKKHNVYYRETEQEFIIIRILHSRMEPRKHLH